MSETWDKTFRELKEDLKRIDQHLASLEQNAWQPRLAVEVDVSADEKTCERVEGATKAVQAMHGDSFFCKKGPRRYEELDLFRREN